MTTAVTANKKKTNNNNMPLTNENKQQSYGDL